MISPPKRIPADKITAAVEKSPGTVNEVGVYLPLVTYKTL